MSEPKEFTDSSVDVIIRAARFFQAAWDFHDVLDLSKYEGEERQTLHNKLFDLQHAAMIIIHSESGPE